MDRSAWRAPMRAVGFSSDEDADKTRDGDVREILAVWKRNRDLYPGWLALPERTRRELLDPWMRDVMGDLLDTGKEDAVLEAVEGKPLATRLRTIHEIVWRRETSTGTPRRRIGARSSACAGGSQEECCGWGRAGH